MNNQGEHYTETATKKQVLIQEAQSSETLANLSEISPLLTNTASELRTRNFIKYYFKIATYALILGIPSYFVGTFIMESVLPAHWLDAVVKSLGYLSSSIGLIFLGIAFYTKRYYKRKFVQLS